MKKIVGIFSILIGLSNCTIIKECKSRSSLKGDWTIIEKTNELDLHPEQLKFVIDSSGEFFIPNQYGGGGRNNYKFIRPTGLNGEYLFLMVTLNSKGEEVKKRFIKLRINREVLYRSDFIDSTNDFDDANILHTYILMAIKTENVTDDTFKPNPIS